MRFADANRIPSACAGRFVRKHEPITSRGVGSQMVIMRWSERAKRARKLKHSIDFYFLQDERAQASSDARLRVLPMIDGAHMRFESIGSGDNLKPLQVVTSEVAAMHQVESHENNM